MAEIQFDTISWTRDANNDIMPLLTPKPFNYPAEDEVLLDIVYGFDDQFTGSLVSGPPPTPPLLTVEDLGGGVARFTISGSTAGSSNKVFIRAATATVWGAAPVVTIAGDGSADATIDPGPYLGKVQSHLAEIFSPSSNEPVLFHLQDAATGYTRSEFGDEFEGCVVPEMLAAFGEPTTYLRGVQSIALAGIQGDAIMANDPATGVDLQLGDASWEFSADDLDFGAGPIVPRAKDQIITAKGEVYIVIEAGVLDAEQIMWTIPCKRSDYKEMA